MRERDQQPGFGEFAPRKLFDSRRWIELELPAQLLRVGSVPFRVEGARVTDEFIHSHPAGQIPVLRKKAHATEHRDRLRNRIEIKHAQVTRFRLEQAEDVFDERGFARAVGPTSPNTCPRSTLRLTLSSASFDLNRRERPLITITGWLGGEVGAFISYPLTAWPGDAHGRHRAVR